MLAILCPSPLSPSSSASAHFLPSGNLLPVHPFLIPRLKFITCVRVPLTWFYLQSDETLASAHASQAGERSGGGQGRSLYAEGVQMLLQAAKEVCAVDDQHEAFGKSCLISEYMLETSAPV